MENRLWVSRRFKAELIHAALLGCVVSSVSVAHALNWPVFDKRVFTIGGTAAAEQFGLALSIAGDVNNDGRVDFIVGSPLADPGGIADAGSAYVFSGADGTLLFQKDGSSSGEQFGFAVGWAGDVNNDGKADFLVGAPYADTVGRTNAGAVSVFSGVGGALITRKYGSDPDIHLGYSVAGLGDLNGDSRSEFAASAPHRSVGPLVGAGSVYVWSGAAGIPLYFQADGYVGGMYQGIAIASAGDVNCDGRSDLVIGDLRDSTVTGFGGFSVYSGMTGTLLYRRGGAAIGLQNRFGSSIAGIGDVNGDCGSDFVIGAYLSDGPDYGAAFVYDGATGALLYSLSGKHQDDWFGYSVGALGDVDGDGRGDFAVGARLEDFNGEFNSGAAHFYSGSTGQQLAETGGDGNSDLFGVTIGGLGDANLDGYQDVVIGASYDDLPGLSDAGSVTFVTLIPRTIELTALDDVGSDQGRQLRLRWTSRPGVEDSLMDGFIVYRRIDPGMVSSRKTLLADPGALPPGEWEQAAIFLATGDSLYTAVVPTLADSTAAATTYSIFFVRGRSTNPLLYVDSPLDSGYSIDNLSPGPPENLIAVEVGNGIDLDWDGVSDPDFDFYWVYRGTSPSFTPAPGLRIAATSNTVFSDTGTDPGATYYYKIRAVDFSGNEGSPSNEAHAQYCDCPAAADIDGNAVIDAVDLAFEIDIVFFGQPDVQDSACPTTRGDFNNDGVADAVDLAFLIDHVFFGGAGPADPCAL